MQEPQQSFADFVAQRHEKDRTVAVYVEGDLPGSPPSGNAVAAHIASYLSGDGKRLKIEPENANEQRGESDAIGAIHTTLSANAPTSQWQPVQMRLLSRVPSDTDIVILVDKTDVPRFCRDLADVRVCLNGVDETPGFYRVKVDAWSGETFYERMQPLRLDEVYD